MLFFLLFFILFSYFFFILCISIFSHLFSSLFSPCCYAAKFSMNCLPPPPNELFSSINYFICSLFFYLNCYKMNNIKKISIVFFYEQFFYTLFSSMNCFDYFDTLRFTFENANTWVLCTISLVRPYIRLITQCTTYM